MLEKTLREWQHRFDEVIFAGDASRLVNEFYHPEAAFIGNGKVSFGRDGKRSDARKIFANVRYAQ